MDWTASPRPKEHRRLTRNKHGVGLFHRIQGTPLYQFGARMIPLSQVIYGFDDNLMHDYDTIKRHL